jgi:thioester reductase-like protein
VSVIGRIGMTIKLRNGEYFSPEVIEGILLKCPSILDIFVHLEMKYGYSVAVVIHSSYLSHLSSDDLEQMILEEIQCISDKEMISKSFLPQSFVFTSVPFTMESNQITSSGKKCRSKILESYRQEIDRCYQRIETRNHMSSLVDIFQQMFHHEAHVTSSTNFWKHGLDSLGIASVVQQIHSKQLFKEIPNHLCKQYLMQSQDIESFVKNLEQSSGHSHLSSLTLEQKEDGHANMKSFSLEEDWKVTAVNDLNWECHSHLLRIPKTLPPDGHMHIFLLGFTGFIGSTIFATLMNLKIDSLTILIRSNRSTKTTTRGVFQRFIVTLLSLSLPQWSTEEEILNSFSSVTIASSIHCRVISRHQQEAMEKSLKPDLFILEGDLSEPNFFLCDQQYEDLLRRTTHCINASGQSSFLSSYFQMRSSNVCTTKQLIQFLTQSTHLIRLIFISSLSASFQPTLPSFHFYELDLPSFNQLITQSIHSCSVEGSLSIGYPLSKMIAEYLISFHCQRDQIPYISLQLGTVSSQSETGFSNLTDFTTRLIHSLVSHNTSSPILNQSTCFGSIDLLSVDFVARVVELFVTKDDLYHNKIMPLYTSVPTPFYDLITGTLTHLSLTDPSASERELISLQDWINQLTPADPLFPLSTVVTDILLSPNPLLRSQSATTEKRKFQILYLSPSEEICVPFEEFDVEKMIPRIVNWILRSSHEKRCLGLLETED